MIVDRLRAETTGRGVARSARIRRDGLEDHEVVITVPSEYAPEHADDATGLLPLCVLIAMRHGQALRIEGRVEPDLLDRVSAIQRLYRAMDPELHEVELEVADTLPPTSLADRPAGVCFSRGVDSLHAAALGRSPAGPIGSAVYAEALEPGFSEPVRAEERALAQEAAGALGLDIVFCEAPIRSLTDGLFDWMDAVGAGLAWIGHSLSGGLSRLVVPSSDSIRSLLSNGTSPVLEPMLGSRALAVEHGEVALTRMGKVAYLAEHRPDVLEFLKVCTDPAAGAGNCGQCAKCRHTMACLRAAGALKRAKLFPPRLDLDAIEASRWPVLTVMVELEDIRAAALERGDDELAAVMFRVLRREAEDPLLASSGPWPASFSSKHSNRILEFVRHGPLSEAESGDSYPVAGIGLVRAQDHRARRHVYGAGRFPSGEIVAELGALMPRDVGDIRLWVHDDGSVSTDRFQPPPARARLRRRVGHVLAPFRRPACQERVAQRLADLMPQRKIRYGARAERASGSLHAESGPSRVPLWSGVHPIRGDQLLADSPEEIDAAGYAEPVLLGYLVARAPLTGRLGSWDVPIPWG